MASESPEVWVFPAASSFALYPWRSISVSVNVHVLEKVCVAQILTCHCYLFFYFSRKYLQIVLPLSEMYLMPKAVCFLPWLYIWLTWWGKQVKPVTLRGCFCCPCWVGLGRHFWLLLCPQLSQKGCKSGSPLHWTWSSCHSFHWQQIKAWGVEDFVLQVAERRTSDLGHSFEQTL